MSQQDGYDLQDRVASDLQENFPKVRVTIGSGAFFGDADVKDTGSEGRFPYSIECKYKDNNTIGAPIGEFDKLEGEIPVGSGNMAVLVRQIKRSDIFAITRWDDFVMLITELDKLQKSLERKEKGLESLDPEELYSYQDIIEILL